VAATAACAVVGFCLWEKYVDANGALTPEQPHVALVSAVADDRIEFHLTYDAAARGVSTLTVLDPADKVLWQASAQGRGRVPVVAYGRVPAEPDVVWTQTFPPAGSPALDVRGTTIRVVVEWEYFRANKWPGSQSAEAVLHVPDSTGARSAAGGR
jgi:hypothetical protein